MKNKLNKKSMLYIMQNTNEGLQKLFAAIDGTVNNNRGYKLTKIEYGNMAKWFGAQHEAKYKSAQEIDEYVQKLQNKKRGR